VYRTKKLMDGCEGTKATLVTTTVNFFVDLIPRQINDALRNMYKPINKTVLL
jgi:hypothetical protein